MEDYTQTPNIVGEPRVVNCRRTFICRDCDKFKIKCHCSSRNCHGSARTLHTVRPRLGCRGSTLLTVIFSMWLSCCIHSAWCSPSGSYKSSTDWYRIQEDRAVAYLGRYGYLTGPSTETGNLMNKDDFIKALKKLQKMGNITPTGVVDRRTLELLARPRCGVRDEDNNVMLTDDRGRRRRKRYTLAPSKWEKSDLTFRILRYSSDMSRLAIRRAITDAFKVWEDVTSLTFTEVVHEDADIMIDFAVDYHHDGYPFDGKGSVLAHAFFPGDDRGGDTHFDDAETWTFNSTEGVDLFMVASHEFGHALGLAHSSNTEALMYPWYQGYINNFKLPYDDVQGIQTLYGSKSGGYIPPVTRPPLTRRPSLTDRPGHTDRPHFTPVETPDINPCKHSIDAITVVRKEVFIFIGNLFWRLGSNGIRGSSTQIHTFWYNLPDTGIDAVYERTDGKIVFFKGNRFWVFSSNHMVTNFPVEGRLISELGIDENVKKVDAVYVWGFNKRTYIITGDMYWKLNTKGDNVEYDYPRDMSIWRNIPVPVDSAFQHWDGKTYFLQGDQYWEFYDNKMRARRKSPKPISKLLGCRDGRLEYIVQKDDDVDDEIPSAANAVKVANSLLFITMLYLLH